MPDGEQAAPAEAADVGHSNQTAEEIKAAQEQQPVSATEQHDPNKAGPASAPPPEAQSGDPLDAATKAGMAGNPPAEGGPTPASPKHG